MTPPTLHVVGLPHTNLTDRFSWCAYTGKVRRFAPMMTAMGYKTVTYHAGLGESNHRWEAGEYVCVLPEGQREARFGDKIPDFDANLFYSFNLRTIAEMGKRIEPGDFICLSAGGFLQRALADAFPQNRTLETGIGYSGVMPDVFHCFESYAWMHAIYGALGGIGGISNAVGQNYDVVIPNYYDVTQFPLVPEQRGDYLLYLARMDSRKGINVAKAVADAAGVTLVTAGSGTPPEGTDHRGVVGPEERAKLLAGCAALIQPTEFLEPFGGCVVEAMLCGVPVITSDWGAFPENVEHGVDGYRCRTLAEYVFAVEMLPMLDTPIQRQARARKRWSMEVVGWQYHEWFKRLATLDGPDGLGTGDGFYAGTKLARSVSVL